MAQQRAVSPEDHVSQPSAPGSGEGSFHKGSGQDDGRGPLPAGMQQQQGAPMAALSRIVVCPMIAQTKLKDHAVDVSLGLIAL